MSLLFKNLVTRSISLRNALNISKLVDNKCLLIDPYVNRANLNLEARRLYATNPDANTFFDLNYKKANNYEYNQRDYGSNKKRFGSSKRFENSNRTGSRFEDFQNAEPVQPSGQNIDYSSKKKIDFKDFNIPERLLSRLNQLGYTSPFEIQEKTLQHTLDGK